MFSEWFFAANLPTWAVFLELIVCGALICMVGARCTRTADLISDMLNLGKAWTGLLLLAGITSLPEVVTGITAVSIRQPDLAFGNIFGSCMFNVAIIVILDGVLRSGSVLRDANPAHSLSSTLGIVLMVLAVLGMTLVAQATQQVTTVSPAVLESLFCLGIAVTYIACMRLNFRFELQLKNNGQLVLPDVAAKRDRAVYFKFGLLAVILMVLTIWLTRTADVLQDQPIGLLGGRTLGASFVGVFFLAAATSLPEIVTSITAVRIGHVDLALGNIFGSNMFNIAVIPILKVYSIFRGDELLMDQETFSALSHTIAGSFAILITGVAVAGLVYRTKRRLFHFGFDSVIIGVIYLIGMYVLLKGVPGP